MSESMIIETRAVVSTCNNVNTNKQLIKEEQKIEPSEIYHSNISNPIPKTYEFEFNVKEEFEIKEEPIQFTDVELMIKENIIICQEPMDCMSEAQNDDMTYQCSQCDEAFSQKSTLKDHLRTHTEEKPYQCRKCEKSFSYNSHLTQHLRKHTGEKPYQCSHCSNAFSQIGTLTKHLKTHTGKKSNKCS